MKTKTFKFLGVTIWKTEICESEREVRNRQMEEKIKVKEEGAVLDYTPEQEAKDKKE